MDMGDLGKMLGDVQAKAQEMQEESANKTYTAKSGGGMVEVEANGKGEILDISLDDSLLDDKDALQILLITAVNEVLSEVENGKKDMAMGMLGGMNPFGSKI